MCEVWRRASDGDTSGRLALSLPREWMSAFVTMMPLARPQVYLPAARRFFSVCSPALLEGMHPLRGPEDLEHHTLIHDRSMASEAHSRRDARGCKQQAFRRSNGERGLQINDSAAAYQTAINGSGIALGRTTLVALDLAMGPPRSSFRRRSGLRACLLSYPELTAIP